MTDDELDGLIRGMRVLGCMERSGDNATIEQLRHYLRQGADAIDALRSPPADVGEVADLRALIEGVGVNLWDKAEMSERDEAGNQTIILWHPSGMPLATLSVTSHAPALGPAHIDLMMSDLLDLFVARERLRALAETTKGDE